MMEYLIFLRNRVGGGRYYAFFDSGLFHIQDNKGSRTVHMRDVKRSYLKIRACLKQ